MVQLEEGIARLKRELAEIRARLRAAHGREDDARLRLANIDAQLIVAGGVNRQESERVLRSALTRQIDEATEEQTAAERDVARLAEAIALAEREADALRARLQDASPPASERAEQPDTRSGDASTPAQPGSEPPPQPEP